VAENWNGPISETLWTSWQTWKTASLYTKWAADNPGEDEKLRYYWNHEGAVPQLATATGKAYVLEANAYWQAVKTELKSYFAPLGPSTATKILVPPETHPKDWNGWPAYDLKTKPGDPVYAIDNGKIPHSYADDVDGGMEGAYKSAYDSKSGLRWGYAHIIVASVERTEFNKGDVLGTAAGDNVHFCCQNEIELHRAIYV
jgi:hypothetical protein